MLSKMVRDFAGKIQKIPIKFIFIALGAVIIGMYTLAFVVPRNVTFSYAGDTCVRELSLLPHQQKSTGDSSFKVEHRGTVGSILATETCFVPTSAPVNGDVSLGSAPFGWAIFQNHYHLNVGTAPKVTASLTTTPIAVTKPVLFAIDKSDNTYSYSVMSETKTQSCNVADKQVSCPVDKLGLAQGSEHLVSLARDFKGNSQTKVAEATISILPAVTVGNSSVKQDQTVYDKPKTFTFTVDKPLVSATVTLELIDGTTTSLVDTTMVAKDTTITVSTTNDLVREKQYRLTLQNAEATDGSTVSEPYVILFKTSGGPKIQSVNIGTSGVDPNARVIVTFDQTLAVGVDITKYASSSGAGTVVSKQGNQVIFSLQNIPRCTAFSLKILKGITSAQNGLPSTNDWVYNSRVNCRATSVIGYSVKGRPITAYFYGSGATTILFTGGMHGSEPSGQQTMQAWATYLDTHAPEIPAGKQVVIVPNTNPDGIATGNRLNASGVNIDRNFATSDWKPDVETSTGILVGGGGSAAMSEPETRAIASLTTQLNPRIEVSFHAAGRLVGANDYADSRAIGTLYASTVGYSTMFGGSAEEIMGYSFSGQYEDYIAERLGKPAILVELPTASGNYLNSQLTALWKMVSL